MFLIFVLSLKKYKLYMKQILFLLLFASGLFAQSDSVIVNDTFYRLSYQGLTGTVLVHDYFNNNGVHIAHQILMLNSYLYTETKPDIVYYNYNKTEERHEYVESICEIGKLDQESEIEPILRIFDDVFLQIDMNTLEESQKYTEKIINNKNAFVIDVKLIYDKGNYELLFKNPNNIFKPEISEDNKTK